MSGENENPEGGGQPNDGEPQPEGGHNLNKGLQRVQQRQAATDRAIQQMQGDMQELVESLKAQPGGSAAGNNSTNTNDALDSLSGNEELTPEAIREALKGHSEAVKKQVSELLDEKIEPVKKGHQESRRKEWWNEWREQHPSLKGRENELIQQAEDKVIERYPNLSDEQFDAALQLQFDTLVEQEEKKSNNSGGEANSQPPENPPENNPKPDGANDGGGNSGGERRAGRLWIPPDEEGA